MTEVHPARAARLLREAAAAIERGASPEGRVRWTINNQPPELAVRIGVWFVVHDPTVVGERRRVVEVGEDFREDWT